jgi:hypothetical protein
MLSVQVAVAFAARRRSGEPRGERRLRRWPERGVDEEAGVENSGGGQEDEDAPQAGIRSHRSLISNKKANILKEILRADVICKQSSGNPSSHASALPVFPG